MRCSKARRPPQHNGAQTYPQSPRLVLLRECPGRVRDVAAAGPTGSRRLWVSRALQPCAATKNYLKNTVAGYKLLSLRDTETARLWPDDDELLLRGRRWRRLSQ